MTSISGAVFLIVSLVTFSGSDTVADDGRFEERNILNNDLLKSASIFRSAQSILRENVLALEHVYSNFNSLMGTMKTVSQSISLQVKQMESSFIQHASGVNGNACLLNLSQALNRSACDNENNRMDVHLEALMTQLKSISHTLRSSDISIAQIKSDDIYVRDCWDIYKTGKRKNGMYRIWPKLWKFIGSFYVYCDLESDNGGWTMIHRRHRVEEKTAFMKTWNEYMFGFGDLNEGFWLGNEKICVLSQQREYQLMITIWASQNVTLWAKYNVFHLAQKNQLFKLQIGGYTGNYGDFMSVFNNCIFSTVDADPSKGNCPKVFSSGWWFNDNYCSLPMTDERGQDDSSLEPFRWLPLNKGVFPILRFEMKIKPIH